MISIGPEKSGTTSFAELLGKTDEYILPSTSPVDVKLELRMWLDPECVHYDAMNLTFAYFNILNSFNASFKNHCSYKWYKHFWSIKYNDIRNKDLFKDQKILENPNHDYKHYYYFEKSPAYWYYPHIAMIFKYFLIPTQNTKFVILLRNPLKRIYSYFILQFRLHRININNGFHEFIEQSMSNKYIKLMQNILSSHTTMDIMKSSEIMDKLLSVWSGYIYKNQQNYVTKTGDEYDTNPWFGIGASCYFVPLLMWLKYIPLNNIKVIQSELLFGNDRIQTMKYMNLFRCWISMDYEYKDGEDMNKCLRDKEESNLKLNITIPHSRPISYLGNESIYDVDHASSVYINYNEFLMTTCKQQLINLFEIQHYKSLTLFPFEWKMWT